MLTGGGAGRVRLRRDVHDAGEPGKHQAEYRGDPRAVHRDAGQGAAAAGNAVRSPPAQIARGKIQALAVADEFPSVMQDLIAVGVKTHFIYHVVAKNNGYKQPLPDVLEDRPGQMDAFGIASGLVAIHTRRPDNSFLEFVRRDNPKSPIFTGFSKANGLPADVPGLTEPVTDAKVAGDRIFKNIPAWAPPVPAPVDIKSVNWASQRYHANWDGNQGASSRTLASGASATGDPRMVNVRIHEPLNPFIDNLPAPPYPFASVDLRAGARGESALQGAVRDVSHAEQPDDLSGSRSSAWMPNRTMVNTSVSRYGLTALVTEACAIYGLNNKGQPGADWCVAEGDWQARLDEYFRDTPRRVAEGTNGYKADMLHGIWAQAPYLHNGSVPTLGQLVCPRDASAPVPSRQPALRRSAGRVRMAGASGGALRTQRLDADQGVRHGGARQGQHRAHVRRGPLSRHVRPGSRPRPDGDRSAHPGIARGRAARVPENAVGSDQGSDQGRPGSDLGSDQGSDLGSDQGSDLGSDQWSDPGQSSTRKASIRSVPMLPLKHANWPTGSMFARVFRQYSSPPPGADRSVRLGQTTRHWSAPSSLAITSSFALGASPRYELLNSASC